MKAKRWLICATLVVVLVLMAVPALAGWGEAGTLTAHLSFMSNANTGTISWYCPHNQYLNEMYTYYVDYYGPDGFICSRWTGVYRISLEAFLNPYDEICEISFRNNVTKPGPYSAMVQYKYAYDPEYGPIDFAGGFEYCGLNVSASKVNGVECGTVSVTSGYGSAVTNIEGYDLLDIKGHQATLTATPNDGYYFAGWKKDGEWTTTYDAEQTVTLTDSMTTFEAVFAKIPKRVVSEVSASLDAPHAGPRDGAGLAHRFKVNPGAYTELYPYRESVYFVNENGSFYEGDYVDGETLTMKIHLSVMTGYQNNTVYTTYEPNYRGAAQVSLALTMNGETNTYMSDPDEGDNLNAYFYIPVTIHNACQVTFNANGHGTLSQTSQTVTYGEKVKRPADPTASGYRFLGWYTNAACTQKYTFTTALKSDLTLYAGWSALVDRVDIWTEGPITNAAANTICTYSLSDDVRINTVIWALQGSTTPMTTQKFMSGKTYTLTCAVKATSVTLTTSTRAYVNGVEATVTGVSHGVLTLTADMPAVPLNWNHTVSYNMNGYGEPIPRQRVQHGAPAYEPDEPTDPDAVFRGYYAETEIVIGKLHIPAYLPFDFSQPVTENTVVDCLWDEYVRDVHVGFLQPLAGDHPADTYFYARGDGFAVSSEVTWRDETGRVLAENEGFSIEETYTFSIELDILPGYLFDMGAINVTIDNATVDSVSMVDSNRLSVSGTYTVDDLITITYDANGHGVSPQPQRYPRGTSVYDMDIPMLESTDEWLFEAWRLDPQGGDYYAYIGDASGVVNDDAILYAHWMEIENNVDLSVYVPAPKTGSGVYPRVEALIGGEVAPGQYGHQNDRFYVGAPQYWLTEPNITSEIYDNLIPGTTYYAYISVDLQDGKAMPQQFTALVNGQEVTFTRSAAVMSTASAYAPIVAGDIVTLSFNAGREDVTNPESVTVTAGTTYGEAFELRFGGMPDPGWSLGQRVSGWLLNGMPVREDDEIPGDVTLVARWADVIWSARLTLEIPHPGDAIGQPTLSQPADQDTFEGLGATWLNADGTPASGAFQPDTDYLCRIDAHVTAGKLFDDYVWITVNDEAFRFTGDRLIVTADIPVTVPADVTVSFESGKAGVAAPQPVTVRKGTGLRLVMDALGDEAILSAADGQLMTGWNDASGQRIDLNDPVNEDITLTARWQTAVARIDVRAAEPQAGEHMLPQTIITGEGFNYYTGYYAGSPSEEGTYSSAPWTAGQTITMILGFEPEDGYAFAGMDGAPVTRVFVNGIEYTPYTVETEVEGFYLLYVDVTMTVAQPGGTLILPAQLGEIGEEAFAGVGVWRVIVPEGVTSIGSRAFANCPNLARVILPVSLTSLVADAFDGCPVSLMAESDSGAVMALAEAAGVIVLHEPAG